MIQAEKARQEEAQKAQQRVNDKTRALRAEAISSAPAKSETGVGGVDEGGIGKMLQGMGGSSRKKELEKELVVAVTARAAVDDKFLR